MKSILRQKCTFVQNKQLRPIAIGLYFQKPMVGLWLDANELGHFKALSIRF